MIQPALAQDGELELLDTFGDRGDINMYYYNREPGATDWLRYSANASNPDLAVIYRYEAPGEEPEELSLGQLFARIIASEETNSGDLSLNANLAEERWDSLDIGESVMTKIFFQNGTFRITQRTRLADEEESSRYLISRYDYNLNESEAGLEIDFTALEFNVAEMSPDIPWTSFTPTTQIYFYDESEFEELFFDKYSPYQTDESGLLIPGLNQYLTLDEFQQMSELFNPELHQVLLARFESIREEQAELCLLAETHPPLSELIGAQAEIPELHCHETSS
jgi:hypothetical protein